VIEPTETWLPIPGYEGLYEISDQWRVWSAPRTGTRGGLRKLSLNEDGYLQVRLNRDGRGVTCLVHQLVAAAFHGPCPPGLEVCHSDGIKVHCAPSNLRYDTKAANHLDQVRHGTHPMASKTCCPKCGGPYSTRRWGDGGVARICHPCEAARERARRRRVALENPAKNEERLVKKREYNGRYRQANLEALRTPDREYRARKRDAQTAASAGRG
jgi:hypothetical protein